MEDLQLRARGFFRRNGSDEVGFHDYSGHLWRWNGLCPFAAANHTVGHEMVGLDEDTLAELHANGHFVEHFVSDSGEPR